MAFRKLPDDGEHMMHREALTRLLRLYYEITPLQAFEEQFDISAALTTALEREAGSTEQSVGESRVFESLGLNNLLAIARHSPGMRWFTKHGSLRLTLLTTLLKIGVVIFTTRRFVP
ncbi:hypothetical protein MRB53_040774 [Persea americana]|nr:hypothetical protein MRB53_040774 [Persea americana]